MTGSMGQGDDEQPRRMGTLAGGVAQVVAVQQQQSSPHHLGHRGVHIPNHTLIGCGLVLPVIAVGLIQ